jgi:hypothetical protein
MAWLLSNKNWSYIFKIIGTLDYDVQVRETVLLIRLFMHL